MLSFSDEQLKPTNVLLCEHIWKSINLCSFDKNWFSSRLWIDKSNLSGLACQNICILGGGVEMVLSRYVP